MSKVGLHDLDDLSDLMLCVQVRTTPVTLMIMITFSATKVCCQTDRDPDDRKYHCICQLKCSQLSKKNLIRKPVCFLLC